MYRRPITSKIAAVVAALLFATTAGAQGEQKFADLGDIKLESGQILKNCRIGYRLHGILNADRSNAILFPTWFGGTSADLSPSIAAGALIDPAGLYVIAVDALGNGVSSSPSNSKEQPGAQFPAITIRDMVNAQRRLVTDVLKIDKLRAVVGISMGGMQAFQWMASNPHLVERVIPIIGTPKQTPQDLLLWTSQLRTIEDHRGSPQEVQRGMRAVARIHALHLWTPANHNRQPREDYVDKLLDTQEKSIADKNAEDWAAQLVAMIGHDIYKTLGGSAEEAAKQIKTRALIVVVTTDMMVNPAPALRLAELIKAKTIALTNDGGHLGLSQDYDRVITAVREFVYRD